MNEKVAWAAGVLEGEGCFSIFKRKDRRSTYTCAILCEMTDEDVVQRLYDTFQVGTVIVRPNISGRSDKRVRKQSYIWSVQNKAGVKEVIEKVLPYLGERRSLKAKELLSHVS